MLSVCREMLSVCRKMMSVCRDLLSVLQFVPTLFSVRLDMVYADRSRLGLSYKPESEGRSRFDVRAANNRILKRLISTNDKKC